MNSEEPQDQRAFKYWRTVWDLSDAPLVGFLALVLLPFALFADFVALLIRAGRRLMP